MLEALTSCLPLGRKFTPRLCWKVKAICWSADILSAVATHSIYLFLNGGSVEADRMSALPA